MTPKLERRKTALLEDCLRYATRRRRAAEASKAEEFRRKLAAEMDEERKRARERAAEQRKRLDLDVERLE